MDLATHIRYLLYLVVPFLCFSCFNIKNDLPVKFAKASLYIYFIYALLQYFDFGFLDELMQQREAFSRGVRSFTPEPSMYGFYIALIMIMLIRNSKVSKTTYIIYLISVLLSGSMAAIIANLPLVLASTLSFGIMYIFTFAILLSLILLFFPFPERVLILLQSPSIEFLFSDLSINERFGHVYAIFTNPYYYIFGGNIPWSERYPEFLIESDLFFWGSDSTNILSGIGGLVYVYGILGLLFLTTLFLNIKPQTSSHKMKAILLSWFMIAIQSVSFANPLLILSLIKFNTDD